MSGPLQMPLEGRVVRLDPRRRVATVSIPSVGKGRGWDADFAVEPDEPLARVIEYGHGSMGRRTAGSVIAVRPQASVAEADLRIDSDSAWRSLAARGRVVIACSFAGVHGIDPYGGRVERVEID